MNVRKILEVVLFCHVFLLVFVLGGEGTAEQQNHHRPRRFLGFSNGTRFFVRLNFKANMIPWNQFFSQAMGFRMNWDDPPDSFHLHRQFTRRSVYKNLEMLIDKNGVSGLHCVRRAICEIAMIPKPRSVYYRILKIIFRNHKNSTRRWHDAPDCEYSVATCPFSLLDLSLYTDI